MPELTEDPIGSAEQGKAGSPESSDCDSADGATLSKKPSVVLRDVGRRVLFYSSHDKKEKYGTLRFFGETEFAEGWWCGIELDKPNGKNNGSRHGIRYFTCEQNYGVFVPLSKVELDPSRRSRSRPGSAPSSRTPSVERTPRKPKTMTPATAEGSGKPQLSPFMLQQKLVNRLATPNIQKRKSTPQTTGGRGGPMKAFATKGVESPSTIHSNKKPNLTPFKSGGIQKAVSSENLRSLKDKEKRTPAGGMTGKKSSSQKDLRSSGVTSSSSTGKGSSPSLQGKNRRKPVRANSHSDLFDTSASSGVSSGSSSGKTSSDINFRRSTDLSSLSDTHVYSWKRTSTPGNRNDQTPDGCSSPEGAEMSDSRSTTSSTGDNISSLSEKMDMDTPATQERGFIATPNDSISAVTSPSVNGSVSLESPPTGLVTTTNQLIRNEKKSPSVNTCRVSSPDGGNSALPKQVYKNRPSGSATLPHPLTLQAAGLTNDISENGIESSSNGAPLLSPNSFKKHFLGPNGSLEGVSGSQLVEALLKHCQQWHSAHVKLEQELAESKAEREKLERRFLEAENSHRTKLQQVEKVHKAELAKMVAAHKRELASLHGQRPHQPYRVEEPKKAVRQSAV